MSAFAAATAMLLSGASASANGLAASPPIASTAPNAAVQTADLPERSEAEPAPAAPTAPNLPTVTRPSSSGADATQSDIVVSARALSPQSDPLQTVNAKSFQITQAVDGAVVGPVALAYERTLPGPFRNGLRNFLGNLHEPVVFLSFLLQLKPIRATETLGRFAVNSTIGGAGAFDVAKRCAFNLPRRANGIADTLGYYGVKPGPFLFLPLIGPTTVRDLIGNGIDRLVLPLSVGGPFKRLAYTLPAGVLDALDRRANFDEQLHKIRDDSADPYVAARRFYFERRQVEIDALRGRRSETGRHTFGIVQPSPAMSNSPTLQTNVSSPDIQHVCPHMKFHARAD